MKDIIWGNKYAGEVIHHVRKAYDTFDRKKEQDTPINLLNASLDKLNHSNMDTNNVSLERIDEAMKLTRDIQLRANELEPLLYESKKSSQKLAAKFKK